MLHSLKALCPTGGAGTMRARWLGQDTVTKGQDFCHPRQQMLTKAYLHRLSKSDRNHCWLERLK